MTVEAATPSSNGASAGGAMPLVDPTWDEAIVGRGARDGARRFREWFGSLSDVAEEGGGAAYVFVMGSMAELLRSFDLPMVFPEVNSLQTAIRNVALGYLNEAEDHGYSPDICGYVKADYAVQMRGGEHPMGRIPKPKIAVLNNGCNTYIKWAEIWERLYGIPLVVIDIPGNRVAGVASAPGSEDYEYEKRYIAGQIKELIETCERVTGKKFDVDKLRECMKHGNEMSRYWRKVVELNRNVPAVFNAVTDGTVFLGMSNCFRATETGARYFKELYDELNYRVENGIGILEPVDGKMVPMDQRFRLSFIGVPCYPIFRNFNEMFHKWGGVFVSSSYLEFASGGASVGHQFDMDADPIDALAEGLLISCRESMDRMFHRWDDVENAMSPYHLDGIVYHPIKSCRTVSTAMADRRSYAAETLGMSTLILESDLMDKRVVSEAQMRNRVDAFFEGLISRKQQAVA